VSTSTPAVFDPEVEAAEFGARLDQSPAGLGRWFVKGTIACSYAAGDVMRRQQGGGAILNMSWTTWRPAWQAVPRSCSPPVKGVLA